MPPGSERFVVLHFGLASNSFPLLVELYMGNCHVPCAAWLHNEILQVKHPEGEVYVGDCHVPCAAWKRNVSSICMMLLVLLACCVSHAWAPTGVPCL